VGAAIVIILAECELVPAKLARNTLEGIFLAALVKNVLATQKDFIFILTIKSVGWARFA
jgi:hypothetical protein